MRTEQQARARSVLNPESLALGISFLLHPFLIVPATLLFLAGRSPGVYLAVGIILCVFGVITVQVRRRRWTNYDVSVRHERRGLYWIALALMASASAALYFQQGNSPMVHGFLAATIMLAFAMIANRWLKVSMHMMFAAFCVVLIATDHFNAIAPLIAALAILAWSRLVLRRHTPAEVAAGTLFGVITGLILIRS